MTKPTISWSSGLRRFAATAVLALLTTAAVHAGPSVGIQTWTLRNMDFDDVVKFCKAHGIENVQAFSRHVDPLGSEEETLKKKKILEENGLKLYTIGVTGTSLDQDKNRRIFEFAKTMGIKLIVVEPGDFRILDLLEELVKEYDIKIAIHNHGIHSIYGNPEVVWRLIKDRDPRVGVCLDVGWITSARLDAAKIFKKYDGRVFDIHFKDKKVQSTENGDVATPAEIGKGDANYKGLFEALREANWSGVMAIETDNNLSNPNDFVAGAIKVFNELK